MKKGHCIIAMALAGSIMLTSCVGSFGLTGRLLDWNRNLDSKFVNQLVFVAFCIVPVYEISILADVLVLNSIEFWSGEHPMANLPRRQTITTDRGVYAIQRHSEGYHIERTDSAGGFDLVFNRADRSWSIHTSGEEARLFRFEGKNAIVMYLPDGREMTVSPDTHGMMAFKLND